MPVFKATASIGSHHHQIKLYFGDTGVVVRTRKSSFQFFPDGPRLISEILVVLSFENQALVFPLQYLRKVLENL
jgi:hypothetical protein